MRSRPMVSVTLAALASHPMTLLLDSGADRVILTGNEIMQFKTSGNTSRLATLNGSMTCTSGEGKLDWGKTTLRGLTLLTCQSVTKKDRDEQGLLPTAIFRQIFISHAGSYAIVNPAKRPRTQELAFVFNA